jgi:hypothetical protein
LLSPHFLTLYVFGETFGVILMIWPRNQLIL